MAEDKRREPEGPAITPTQPSMPASRPGPDGKPTTEMPKVPDWAIELTRSVKDGFAKTNANIEMVSNDLSVVKDRVAIIESWRSDQEARATKVSGGVRALSQTDLAHEAQLAAEKAAREALAKQVAELTTMQETQLAILGRLDKVASNPMVKTVMTVLGTALATWAASKGLK